MNHKLIEFDCNFFFFFVNTGGQPDTVCKFNIVNLNKQAKLFSQGMNPVIRLGETGKWERTKDSPLYEVSQSMLSIVSHLSNSN